MNKPQEFRDNLRRLLSQWARDWGDGVPPKAVVPDSPSFPGAPPSVEVDSAAPLLKRTTAAAKAGRSTMAHQLFTQATTGTYDRDAWTEYVRFLRRTNRLGLLQSVGGKMIEQARDLGDHQGAAKGLSNLGIAQRAQGQREVAINYFDSALAEVAAWEKSKQRTADSISMRAFLLDNKGLTWRSMPGHLPDAMNAVQEAIGLHAQVGDNRGKAHALRNAAVIATQMGSLSRALESLEEARVLFTEADNQRGVAMTLSSLGETLEALGQPQKAVEQLEMALEKNTNLHNSQGRSMNLSQLSRAHLALGNISAANESAEACLALNESRGNTEGLAAALHAVGRVRLAQGEYDKAREILDDAFDLFSELHQSAGEASVAIDIAQTNIQVGNSSDGQKYLERAIRSLDQSPHYGIGQLVVSVQEQLANL